MAKSVLITVKEEISNLKSLYSKAQIHLRPRYKMLLLIAGGQTSSQELAAKTGVSRNTIAIWKLSYSEGGIEQLTSDLRGGDYKSNISADDKKKIEKKLSDVKNAFTSFAQAQTWLKEELGIDKNYHAVNKYLKRNFGAKLKVGRKSHVKKDEAAVAVFKKPTRGAKTY
jgi:transposase